jgi:hypothetical protein
MLAQRLARGGAKAYYDKAAELRLQAGDTRKWEKAWRVAMHGPCAPYDRW